MGERVLVVDANAAFATVLKEMLEREGGYEVRVAPAGSDALAILQREHIDLTIVDVDLDPEDMGYRDLIRRIRQVLPNMRLVLIPQMGHAAPPEARALNLQGTLAKPFFADDLLPNIKAALSAPLAAATLAGGPPPREKPVAPRPPLGQSAGRGQPAHLHEIVVDLARETRADLVALVSLGGRSRVLSQVGKPGSEAAESLAGYCLGTLQAAQRLACLLGQPDTPFEHNMFESQSFRVYILSLPGDLALLLAAPLEAPLGAIRHNLRRAGRELAQTALT